MGKQTLRIDIAIIGGGIAGLWALQQLRQAGFSAALFEHRALGSDQSIASQGIIHSGVKYTLSGNAGDDESERLQTMGTLPAVWRKLLAGEGSPDLQACRLLSEHVYLWSTGKLATRLAAFFAHKALGSRPIALTESGYPKAFRSPGFRGTLHQLDDFVVDVSSLLQALIARHRDAIFSIDWRTAQLENAEGYAQLRLSHCIVKPQQLLLAAGAGNRQLLADLGTASPAMQKRPLQQVLVKHQYPHPVFAHCVGNTPEPRLTISTHHTPGGEPVWYLGGKLATAGAQADPQQLIATAKSELAELMPWVDLGVAEWRTLAVDRAELDQPTALRPAQYFVGEPASLKNVRVLWPTKLTLCPQMGDELERQLRVANIQAKYSFDQRSLNVMGQPPLAEPLWHTVFQ